MKEVYILVDTNDTYGEESIIGVYSNEQDAHLALAKHVLSIPYHIEPGYIYIAKKSVE